VTLSGAFVNVALDPLLIFGLGLGIEGAALASALSRFAALSVGLYGVARVHGLLARPAWHALLEDAPRLGAIAAPAVLANVATPTSNAYVTGAIAAFGDAAVAGWAIIGRIIPVAFGAIYALSGSVGPILGQNLGARRIDRMREAFTQSLLAALAFTLGAWLVLAVAAGPLVRLFGASGDAAALVVLFCRWLAPLFVFLGWLFVANAAFNTMRRPHYATALNWGRATLGTVPLVELGSRLWAAEGVLLAHMLSGVAFGLVAVWGGYRLIASHDRGPA
jgi:Na+-driven multidrug efflux pump